MVAVGLSSHTVAADRDDGTPHRPAQPLGQKFYDQSRKLLDHFEGAMPATLELLLYHVMAVGLMLVLGNWRLACYHVVQGLHTRLNMPAIEVQKGNGDHSHEARAEVERAWYTLRHFDKRIAQVAGTPHMIRREYYSTESFGAYSAFKSNNRTHLASSEGIITSVLDHDELWEIMWDQFLAPNASKADDWAERRALDSKIAASLQLLPSELGWTTKSMEHLEGEWELSLRRRLAIQLRYQQLRMKLWHRIESVSDLEQYRSKQGFEVAQEVIEAIASYMKRVPSPLAGLGLHSTIALVEAIHHIVAEKRNPAGLVAPEGCNATLQVASRLLYRLADSHIMAQYACQLLSGVLEVSLEPHVMRSVGSGTVPMHDNFPMEMEDQPELLSMPNQESLFSWDCSHQNTPRLTSIATATTNENAAFDVSTSTVEPMLSFDPCIAYLSADVNDLIPQKLPHWLTDAASGWGI